METTDIPITVHVMHDAERDFALSVMREAVVHGHAMITGWAAPDAVQAIRDHGAFVDEAPQPGPDLPPLTDDVAARGGVLAVWTRWGIGADEIQQIAAAAGPVLYRLPVPGYQFAVLFRPNAVKATLALAFVAAVREIAQLERDAEAAYGRTVGPRVLG